MGRSNETPVTRHIGRSSGPYSKQTKHHMHTLCLTAINARYTHSNPALLYLREAVRDLPVQTDILACTITQPVLDILQELHARKPDWVGLSVYIWNTEKVRLLLPEIKKVLPETKIILGGPEVSYAAEKWLAEFPDIDFIIRGAGENALRTLLNDSGRCEKIISQPPPALDDIPFPYRDEDFPEMAEHYIYYESSRGCPFSCAYCLSSRTDMRPDYRSVDKVCRELDMLCGHTPRIVKFIDRTFNARKSHSLPIWEHLIKKNPDTCFHFELHAGLLTDRDFEVLARAPEGLFQFEIGIQSTSPVTLDAINRKIDWDLIRNNIRKLMDMGTFHVHVDLIAGLPFEDMTGLSTSFNEVYELGAHALQLGFLKVLPGTEIADKTTEYGIESLDSAPYQVLKTEWLSFAELSFLEHLETALDRLWNSGRFSRTTPVLTDLYPTPFDFYRTFTKFALARSEMNEKQWPKVAALILAFIDRRHPARRDYVLDCLRWDWCFQASSQYYPPILDNGLDHLLRHKRRELRTVLRENNIELTQSEINSTVLFLAGTEEFSRETAMKEVLFIRKNGTRVPVFPAR